MGKHGPCYHCGVTSTPLWRNGPPEKPVLCNACGSRWRTKGSLANYTPLHARDELDDLRLNKTISITIKNKEPELLKRKLTNDEDTSNRSSCGSAISNSNYAAQSGSDFTSCPNAWDPVVPSRKRSCVTRLKPSPVEVLTKDLYTLWYQQQSSCLSASSEEDLLLQTHNKPIGHGSLLIRHPNSLLTEEESEASSLSVDNNQYNSFSSLNRDAYSYTRLNKKNAHSSALLEQTTRDKDQVVKLPILAHHNSPLCYIDLQDIVNFEMFSNYLTNDEQQQLMKLLPSVDILDAPYSLKSLFGSSEFNLNLSSFQKLIAEGVFDNSFGGVNTEDCRILKKLVLCDLAKSKWVEQHTAFKDLKCESSIKSEVVGGYNGFKFVTGANLKRSRDGHNQKYTGSRVSMKSPSRVMTKSSFGEKELIDKDEAFLSGRSLFSIQNDNELLIDVPSNGSFPQAELLPSSSYGSSSLYPNLVHP